MCDHPVPLRSKMVSLQATDSELIGWSISHIESLTSKRNARKSLTLSRLLSVEGLDLGLPGVYRSKADGDCFMTMTDKVNLGRMTGQSGMCSVSNAIIRTKKHSTKSESLPVSNGPKIISSNLSALAPCVETFPAIPPKKPPRTKLRLERSMKLKGSADRDVMNDSQHCGEQFSHDNRTRSEALNNVLTSRITAEDTNLPPLRPMKTLLAIQDSKAFATVKENGCLGLSKPVKSKLSSKSYNKCLAREQLKSSLSMPFDFRKISGGKMPEAQPLDLLLSHQCEKKTEDIKLPGPRHMHSHQRDNHSLQSVSNMQGPDILSHLENHQVAAGKYHTMTHTSGRIMFNSLKKKSWFSKHLTRKKFAKDPLAEPLLLNQGDPLDHGLMVRKDSHGSTEDESMDNNHLDVKDKKKKDKDKKKDKKGKPPSRHGSDAKQSDKVRSKLRKFISKRPTMESLQERGLIKETVFGCPLYKLCEKEGTTVPKFVRMCVQEVETRGLKVDGIYRVSGNLSHVQKLRYMVDREIPVDLSTTEWEDIHVITGALKMFLRELPEPVIPFTFFDKFIATCKITSANSRLETTKSLIRALPTPNKETLKYLMQHFCRVVEKKECNRMQVQNVAIVFGPTLLLNPPETTNHYDPGGGHMAVYLMYQNQIIDYMLTEYKSLF